MQKVTPIDIHQRQFRRQMFGYNKDEVDDFLDEIIATFEDMIRENTRLKEQVESLGARLQEYKEREDTINGAVLSAQAASEQMKLNARKEAELIIEEAKFQAARLVDGAQERLRQATEESAAIQRQAQTIRAQLRSFLVSHLEMLDDVQRHGLFGEDKLASPSGERRSEGAPLLEVIPSKHHA